MGSREEVQGVADRLRTAVVSGRLVVPGEEPMPGLALLVHLVRAKADDSVQVLTQGR